MKRAPSPSRDNAGMLSGEQRLNKLLAAAGLGARRQVDELIEQGRVEVDSKIVEQFGMKVDVATSVITVDGTPLKKLRPAYFALHKPTGVLCTNRDPQGRSRAIDMVPGHERLFPVGRLDASSVGLLLLTNDGELAQQLTHPKYGVPKTYFVVVAGQLSPDEMKRLRRGIYLSDGVARVDFVKIKKLRKGSTELEITLSEGKNREIRRVLARLGHKVVTLRRLSIGPLKLAAMPVGAYRPLTKDEVTALYRAADDAKRARGKRKELNQEHQSERDIRLAKKEAARALAGEPVEPTSRDSSAKSVSKKSEGKSASQSAGPRSREPMKEVVDRTPAKRKSKDPFDWDDDELLLASPFGANHPSGSSDEADDDDDGWVTPLMAGMNEDDEDEMPGKAFHKSSVETDAILLRDGGSDRVGDVLDYDDEGDESEEYDDNEFGSDEFSDEGAEEESDDRSRRAPRGRNAGRSPKKPAPRPGKRSTRSDDRTDTRIDSRSGTRTTAGSAARKGFKSGGRGTKSARSSSSETSGYQSKGSERGGERRSSEGRSSEGRKKGTKKFAPGKRSAKGAIGRATTGVSESSGRGRADRAAAPKKGRSFKKGPAIKKGGPRSGATTKRSSFKKSAGKGTKRTKR